MIYEPSLNKGETRDAYLERFRRVNRPAWTFLSDQGVGTDRSSCYHLRLTGDERDLVKLGREAGFARATELFCDPTGFYRIYRYDVKVALYSAACIADFVGITDRIVSGIVKLESQHHVSGCNG